MLSSQKLACLQTKIKKNMSFRNKISKNDNPQYPQNVLSLQLKKS